MTKVAIIIYSMYGHVATLAETVKRGVESVEGVEATILQVPETLPELVLEKMHAPPKKDYPIATPDVLTEYDGILWGMPSRFGMMPAQIKAFFDGCGGLCVRTHSRKVERSARRHVKAMNTCCPQRRNGIEEENLAVKNPLTVRL